MWTIGTWEHPLNLAGPGGAWWWYDVTHDCLRKRWGDRPTAEDDGTEA